MCDGVLFCCVCFIVGTRFDELRRDTSKSKRMRCDVSFKWFLFQQIMIIRLMACRWYAATVNQTKREKAGFVLRTLLLATIQFNFVQIQNFNEFLVPREFLRSDLIYFGCLKSLFAMNFLAVLAMLNLEKIKKVVSPRPICGKQVGFFHLNL